MRLKAEREATIRRENLEMRRRSSELIGADAKELDPEVEEAREQAAREKAALKAQKEATIREQNAEMKRRLSATGAADAKVLDPMIEQARRTVAEEKARAKAEKEVAIKRENVQMRRRPRRAPTRRARPRGGGGAAAGRRAGAQGREGERLREENANMKRWLSAMGAGDLKELDPSLPACAWAAKEKARPRPRSRRGWREPR